MARHNPFRSFREQHSFRRHSIRSDFVPRNVRMPKGRGDAVVASLNKDWQSASGRTAASRMQANNGGHFIDEDVS